MQPKTYYEQQREEFDEYQKKRLTLSVFTKVALATVAMATVIVVATFFIGKKPKVDFLDIYYTKAGDDENLRYDVNFAIMIEEEHDSLKPNSILITLDSVQDHFEMPGTLGMNSNKFSDLMPNREYKLRVKGNWGYGLGTIREHVIKLNQDAKAKIVSVDQFGLNLSYSFYVIDTFEALEDSNVTVNVYEQNELLETINYSFDNFNNRTIRLTNNLVLTKERYEIKIEILNNTTKLVDYVYKVNKDLSANLEYYFHTEGDQSLFSYTLQINDGFDKINGDTAYIKLKSNAQTYTDELALIDKVNGVYTLYSRLPINRLGEYKMEVRVKEGDTLKLIATFDLIAIPSFEIVNVRNEDGLIFDLRSNTNLSITIKNKIKLEAKLYDFINHGGHEGEALASKKIDPHNLNNITFKDVDPNLNYIITVTATLYGKSEVVATYYSINEEDYIFFNTILHDIENLGVDFKLTFISNLINNSITNYRLVITGIDSNNLRTEFKTFENFPLDTELTYRYDLADNLHRTVEFKLFATRDGVEEEIGTRLIDVPLFRAKIIDVISHQRNLNVYYEIGDIEPVMQNLRMVLVDSNNKVVGLFYLTNTPDISFTPPVGNYTIEIRGSYYQNDVLWASYEGQFTLSEFGEITAHSYDKAAGEFSVTVDSHFLDDGSELFAVVKTGGAQIGGDQIFEIPFDNDSNKITKKSLGFIEFFKTGHEPEATYTLLLVRRSGTGGETEVGSPIQFDINKPVFGYFEGSHFADGTVNVMAEGLRFNTDLDNVADKEILYEVYLNGVLENVQQFPDSNYSVLNASLRATLDEQSVVIIKAYYVNETTNDRIYIGEIKTQFQA